MIVEFTDDEVKCLVEYIDFMEQFDDDPSFRSHALSAREKLVPTPGLRRTCRMCGCTDDDCSECIEKTGAHCHWVEPDLCSACVTTIIENPGVIRSLSVRSGSGNTAARGTKSSSASPGSSSDTRSTISRSWRNPSTT